MGKHLIIIIAIVFAYTNIYAQKRVNCKRTYTCWNEAAQKDTVLSVDIEYGKLLASSPKEQLLACELSFAHGDPHIKSVSALFRYNVDISATKPEKFLGVETTRKLERVDIVSQVAHLRQNFIKIKEIYEKWSETAKKEGVSDYRKMISDTKIYNVPCIYSCYDENNDCFLFSTGLKQQDLCKAEFIVDENGNCMVFWGIGNKDNSYSPAFHNQHTIAQYGGLVKKDVKQTNNIRVHKAGLWFTSPEQIQSLIDALDYDSIIKECKVLFNKKDPRDELFK